MTDSAMPQGGGPQALGLRSMAVGGDVGVAITGDGTQVVMLPAEAVGWAKETEAPPGSGNLPNSASGVFVGRESELTELRRLLAAEGEAAVIQVSGTRAIHGLGGIGKSTLALHYAHAHRHTYRLVWWINAASTEQIIASLASLTTRLCPQWAATTGVHERAAWAILWLQWHPGWLLVFDNVDRPDDLRHYLGALPDGHHLATSRTATGWHAIAPTMSLGLLAPEAAIALLCTLALGESHSPTPTQRQDAAALAADLGHLPLALEQAGAYLFETGTSLADYREMLSDVMDTAVGGIDPERTIARVWHHTLAAIKQRNSQAITLLSAMAWLAPDDIPRSLLAPLCPDPRTLGEALGALHAYNMISHSADRQALSVHRLVQAVLRKAGSHDVPPRGRREAEHVVGRLLYPDSVDEAAPLEQWEQLIEHVIALASSTPAGYASKQPPKFYQPVITHLHEQCQDARAIPLHEAMLARCEEVLGDNDPYTLASRGNLAYAYHVAGHLRRAISLNEKTLTQREQVLGETHPATLANRNSLAYAYSAVGEWKRAIALFETTLSQRKETLGDEHPSTLTSQNNLAYAYEAVGDLGRAIPLFEDSVAKHEQILGYAHPQTLYSRNNLAHAYEANGDLKRATSLYEITLADRERVLGATHPHTLQSRNNLAHAYQGSGNLARAIPLFETTLTQRVQVLGDAHPDTLISKNNLAFAYKESGDFDRSIPLLESVVAQWEQVLGETHPDTLNGRNNLATAYDAAGVFERALPLYEATLVQRVEVLGNAHPDTLISRNNLASAHFDSGDLARAIPLFETVVAQSEQVLGNMHPYTLLSRSNLASAYESAGDLERAIPLFETALLQREQVLGETHPHTLTTRNNLAGAYFKAGQRDQAIVLYELTVAQSEQALGNTHPDTLISRSNLAHARHATQAGQRGGTVPPTGKPDRQRPHATG
ncbi:FxSxx-COOH system tetratricopeptide repeat protein [Streptomyces afghaniensis]|uniref:FxSxx-COOH system tetratricopeptide repeat protein n=1 Tax=Streptomyces afghaniensis TaxID=66865 RepID=UPI0037B13197